MIRLSHQLLFPQLIRCGETTFKAWSDRGSTTLYRLDWDTIDKIKEENFRKWVKNTCGSDGFKSWTEERKYPGSLPEKYDTWVKNMVFSIPQDYIDEIRRNARIGLLEWATERHFDTMIREICLMPAIAYIYVAFRMVADCLYDQTTNYFYRGDDKIIAPQALLYKFWTHQTGRGLIRDHAYFRNITWIFGEKSNETQNDSKTNEIMKFIQAIDEYEKITDKAYTVCFSTPEKLSGPSIEGPADPENKPKARGANSDILVITVCENNKNDLVKALPSWIGYNFKKIVILDKVISDALPATEALNIIKSRVNADGIESDIDVAPYIDSDSVQDIINGVLKTYSSCERVLFISPTVKIKGFDYPEKAGFYRMIGTHGKILLMTMETAKKYVYGNSNIPEKSDLFRDGDFILA